MYRRISALRAKFIMSEAAAQDVVKSGKSEVWKSAFEECKKY
jgi:hypothetical protein